MRGISRRNSIVAGLITAGMFTGVAAPAVLAAPAQAATRRATTQVVKLAVAPRPQASASVVALARTGFEGIAGRSSASDKRYVSAGRFVRDGVYCPRCDASPATGAAALAAVTKDPKYLSLAIQATDNVIARYQMPSGAFGPAPANEGDPSIQTTFMALGLGVSLDALWSSLPAAKRTAWVTSLTRAADYLGAHGNYRFYTNGNISLGNAAVAGMAWKFTGNPAYRTTYDQALDFVIAPGPRWTGFGLKMTRKGVKADGSDSAGYFAEAGSGGVGLDTEYTMVQANMATVMYLVTRDSRALNVLNILTNQLTPRVDRKTWKLDTSGGTRHPQLNRSIYFGTPAVSVLYRYGGRSDLATAKIYAGAGTSSDSFLYQGWAIELAPMLLATSR
jgi:hypothetical protein